MKKLFIILTMLISPCFAEQVEQNNNQFALDLYSMLAKEGTPNIVFSSYSIYSNLSMVYLGAKGQTAEEMGNVLRITNTSSRLYSQNHDWILRLITPPDYQGYKLQIANGIFTNKGISVLKNFKNIATENFNAAIQSIDFAKPDNALKSINNWFSDQTNGKIPNLLEKADINSSTRFVLTSAIYFEGKWVNPFDARKTTMAPFHVTRDETIQVPMMQQTGSFAYFETDIARGIWLPIVLGPNAESTPSCVILLPREDALFDNLEMSFDVNAISHWMAKSTQKYVDLQLPKFCFSQKLPLNAILQQMGMKLPFTTEADFSGISGNKDLYLSRVVHGAFFALDEKGITAAAGTASSIGIKSAPTKEQPISFKVDRPFLFFLVDQNAEAILFMGKLSRPDLATCP